MARPSKREQILEALQRCFYENGITATGVDSVAAAAGVSKRTLYNHFPTKDDLVLHYVEWREDRWRERLDARLSEVSSAADRILVYFDVYFESPTGGDFRGCGFIIAAAEIVDEDSPALAAIAASKERVRADIEDLLVETSHPRPAETATAVAALLEGACTIAGIKRDTKDLETFKRGALALVEAMR